jgi:hypothetical protein
MMGGFRLLTDETLERIEPPSPPRSPPRTDGPVSAGISLQPLGWQTIGSPIDMLVFDGLSDPEKELDIIILEIKTGRSALNKNERRVSDAVEPGRVTYEVYELPDVNVPGELRRRGRRPRLGVGGGNRPLGRFGRPESLARRLAAGAAPVKAHCRRIQSCAA